MIDDRDIIQLSLDLLIDLLLLILDIRAIDTLPKELLTLVNKVVDLVDFGEHVGLDDLREQTDADVLVGGEVGLLLLGELVEVVPVGEEFLVVVDGFLVLVGVGGFEVLYAGGQ